LTRYLFAFSHSPIADNIHVHLWDGIKIQQLLNKHPGVQNQFSRLLEHESLIQKRMIEPERRNFRSEELLKRLDDLEHGHNSWGEYEDLCIEILNFAFIPPLLVPKLRVHIEQELPQKQGLYSISYGNPCWDFLKSACRTSYAIAMFKNLTKALCSKDVESIEQFLFTKSMRSLGILCSRFPPSDSALKARRRAWLEADKLIFLLSDNDLIDILQARTSGTDPSEVLNVQLIEFLEGIYS
jgi:hypothetical protein